MNIPSDRKQPRRGITLLESVIYVTLMAMIAVATMAALGRSAVLRGMAENRSEMLVIAQTELDRIRLLPGGELNLGPFERSDDSWPPETTVQGNVTRHSDNVVLVRVTVSRDLAEGIPDVTLESAVRRPAL